MLHNKNGIRNQGTRRNSVAALQIGAKKVRQKRPYIFYIRRLRRFQYEYLYGNADDRHRLMRIYSFIVSKQRIWNLQEATHSSSQQTVIRFPSLQFICRLRTKWMLSRSKTREQQWCVHDKTISRRSLRVVCDTIFLSLHCGNDLLEILNSVFVEPETFSCVQV